MGTWGSVHISNSGAFVTRVGQQLLLNGSPFRMLGFNIWRANIASQQPNTGYFVNNGTTLADSLDAINANGGGKNTIRAWFFQQYVTPGGVAYNWAAFDKTLLVAASKGFKVIATLTDQWAYEGPPYKDTAWYSGGYQTQVYSGTLNSVAYAEAVPYRQFVQDVVTRYKDNPTIAAWELVNEAEVQDSSAATSCPVNAVGILSAFVQDVGTLIKSIDANHLVSLGMAGNGNCGTIEGDYQTIVALPQIDLCSFHDYYGAASSTAFNQYNGLNVRISQAAAVNKPIYIGEVGLHLNTSPVNGSLTTRATYLGQKMSAQLGMQGVVGYIPWQWDSRGYSDDYNFSLNDPGLAVMSTYAL
jgi:mannan endo-1,4-beta-mannosidase